MRVLVDTSVWSLALRRPKGTSVPPTARILGELVRDGRVEMMGLIRQELLSGVKDARQFDALCEHLRAFPDVPLDTADHEEGAAFFNQCRSRGVQGSTIDFLICAVASRRGFAILTTDADFERYARHLPIQLYPSPIA